MKKAIFGVLLVAIVAISLGGCEWFESKTKDSVTTQTSVGSENEGAGDAETKVSKRKGDRWEYTNFTSAGRTKDIEKANALGDEGWELAGVYLNLNGSGDPVLIFKRKLP